LAVLVLGKIHHPQDPFEGIKAGITADALLGLAVALLATRHGRAKQE
jgi:hypothetical protein